MVQSYSFSCGCSVFPAPFIEEAVFAPLYILASFVKNKVPIGASEKAMAPHSSTLAWRIPGTGEPGGLPDVYGVAQSQTRLKQLSSSSSIGAWVYFWAFYLVPLVYISVFVPVPYYLDDCRFAHS